MPKRTVKPNRVTRSGSPQVLEAVMGMVRPRLRLEGQQSTTWVHGWLSLRRLAYLIRRAIEQRFGVTEVVQHRYSAVLS